MHSALPKIFPSNIIINKTIRATESDTNHHTTLDFNLFLLCKCTRPGSLFFFQNYYELNRSGKIKFDFKVKFIEELLCPLSHCPWDSMQLLTIQHALQTCSGILQQWRWQTEKLNCFEWQGRGHLWLNSHLSGFGWGLNKGNAVAAC